MFQGCRKKNRKEKTSKKEYYLTTCSPFHYYKSTLYTRPIAVFLAGPFFLHHTLSREYVTWGNFWLCLMLPLFRGGGGGVFHKTPTFCKHFYMEFTSLNKLYLKNCWQNNHKHCKLLLRQNIAVVSFRQFVLRNSP